MRATIEAVYENGVLKPLKKLRMKEHEKIRVTIERKPSKTKHKKSAMALVGIFDSGIGNLSKDHDK